MSNENMITYCNLWLTLEYGFSISKAIENQKRARALYDCKMVFESFVKACAVKARTRQSDALSAYVRSLCGSRLVYTSISCNSCFVWYFQIARNTELYNALKWHILRIVQRGGYFKDATVEMHARQLDLVHEHFGENIGQLMQTTDNSNLEKTVKKALIGLTDVMIIFDRVRSDYDEMDARLTECASNAWIWICSNPNYFSKVPYRLACYRIALKALRITANFYRKTNKYEDSYTNTSDEPTIAYLIGKRYSTPENAYIAKETRLELYSIFAEAIRNYRGRGKDAIIEWIRDGGTISEICAEKGISCRVYQTIKKHVSEKAIAIRGTLNDQEARAYKLDRAERIANAKPRLEIATSTGSKIENWIKLVNNHHARVMTAYKANALKPIEIQEFKIARKTTAFNGLYMTEKETQARIATRRAEYKRGFEKERIANKIKTIDWIGFETQHWKNWKRARIAELKKELEAI